MDFDQAYYDRFYHNPDTSAVKPGEQARQARFIAAYLRYLQIPIRSVLDIGCGIGTILTTLQRCFPKADCTGVEHSSYLCDTYGWQHGSVTDYAGAPRDLVVCTDVLAYLDKKACRRAIKNLARLSDAALYLSVVTNEDQPNIDQQHTDMRQKLRDFAWYDKLLNQHFVRVGGGLFLSHQFAETTWRLERL